jgi:uncharacterized protein YjdB
MQPVTWSTSNSKVVGVNATTGLVTAKGLGVAAITATTNDGLKIKGTYAVTVGVVIQALTLTAPDAPLLAKGKATVSVGYGPINATTQKVSWKSSDLGVETVSSAGLVTAKAVTQSTKVTISATALDDSGVTGELELWVRPLVTGIQLVDERSAALPAILTLNMNDKQYTYQLGAKCRPYADVASGHPGQALQGAAWSSSKTAVATVDQNGLVTAVAEGTAMITATATDGSKKSAKVIINVQCRPESVTISGSANIAYGKSEKLSALVGPAGVASQAVTWRLAGAEDAKLATISVSAGTVTAKNVAATLAR